MIMHYTNRIYGFDTLYGVIGSQFNKDQLGEVFAMTKILFPDQIDEKGYWKKFEKAKQENATAIMELLII